MSATALNLEDDFVIGGHVVIASAPLDAANDLHINANFRLNKQGIVVSVSITFPPVPVNLPLPEHTAIETLASLSLSGQTTLDRMERRKDIPSDTIAGKLIADAVRTAGPRSQSPFIQANAI